MLILEKWYMQSTWTARRQGSLAVLVGLFVALSAVALAAAPASAQSENPYGSTSTTAPGSPTPSCSIEQTSGANGAVISGTVFDVEAGSTVDFYLGGVQLGTIEVPAGPQAFWAAPITATTDVAFSFTVPADLEPGMYAPVIVGTTFNTECALPGGADAFEVLAASDERGDGESGGDLAFTGFEILFLVFLGLLLIAVGYAIVRRRRNYTT